MKVVNKFFKLYLMIFAFLGLVCVLSLHESSPIALIAEDVLGARAPASVAKAIPLKSTEILKVGCDDNAKEISVHALQVRLEGMLCHPHSGSEVVSIENETTGKTAMLFVHGKTQYTTDYIQLKNGKNQISLRYNVGSKSQKMDWVLIQ